jgi:hypothetical protein
VCVYIYIQFGKWVPHGDHGNIMNSKTIDFHNRKNGLCIIVKMEEI